MQQWVLTYSFLFSFNFLFAQQWDHIIENREFTSPVELKSPEWNNTIIRNCKIHNTGKGKDGIFLRNVSNVRIENCEIYNIEGQAAIRLSISGAGTDSVTIIGNKIYNVAGNGINAPQRSQNTNPLDQKNLRIINNIIYNTGLAAHEGKYHAIYCQASDFLIEGNTIYGERDGNGISVRSSGKVIGNTVSGWSKSNKPAIRYFSDHMVGVSNELLVENNMVWNDRSAAPCIDVFDPTDLYADGGSNIHVVKYFTIRFNTAVSFRMNQPALNISNRYLDKYYQLMVSGNIAVNTTSIDDCISVPPNTILDKNYTGSRLDDFVRETAPFNFRITPDHTANSFATGLTSFPLTDIDGNPRDPQNLDSGAFQSNLVTDSNSRHQKHKLIKIFPNPGNGIYKIVGLQNNELIEVVDSRGTLVHSMINTASSAKINLTSEVSGLYFIKIYRGNHSAPTIHPIIKLDR